MLARAALLRCPNCGARGILRHWFKMNVACPACGLMLDRGESSDFWLGAYALNLVVAELITIIVIVVWVVSVWPDVPWTTVQWVAVILAGGMPLLFFPFARTLWLAFDLGIRKSEPGDVRRS